MRPDTFSLGSYSPQVAMVRPDSLALMKTHAVKRIAVTQLRRYCFLLQVPDRLPLTTRSVTVTNR